MEPATKQLILVGFTPPFEYDPHGQSIIDKDNKQVVDIRGWGHLQKLGEPCASSIQDNLGEEITNFLNESLLETE